MNGKWRADFGAAVGGRRGVSPQQLGISATGQSCPDILELENGDFLVIGTEATKFYGHRLSAGASCADYESIVVIPGVTMHSAAHDIVGLCACSQERESEDEPVAASAF